MSVAIGDEAPGFELKDQSGEVVSLGSFRGEKAVALVFYPFTFTGVCEGELCELRDGVAEFEARGVQVLAVSCDSRHAQARWAADKGWSFPVLSDFWPHGAVATAYGVFNEDLGCAMRATFLIDRDGRVVDTFASEGLGTARSRERYDEALATLA